MAIFHSYVKLPEGICLFVYGVLQPRKIIKSLLWWVGFLRPFVQAAAMYPEGTTSQESSGTYPNMRSV